LPHFLYRIFVNNLKLSKFSNARFIRSSDSLGSSGGGVFLAEALRGIRRHIKLGTRNFRSLYRAGFLKAAATELARYKLDVVGVPGGSWDKEGTVRAGDYNSFYGKGNENHQLGTGFCTP